jgi:hypothetical protein
MASNHGSRIYGIATRFAQNGTLSHIPNEIRQICGIGHHTANQGVDPTGKDTMKP